MATDPRDDIFPDPLAGVRADGGRGRQRVDKFPRRDPLEGVLPDNLRNRPRADKFPRRERLEGVLPGKVQRDARREEAPPGRDWLSILPDNLRLGESRDYVVPRRDPLSILPDELRLRATVAINLAGGDPEVAARANAVARRLGIAPETAERRHKTLGDRLRAEDANHALLKHNDPYLMDFYSKPRNAAAASDDMGPLASISRRFRPRSSVRPGERSELLGEAAGEFGIFGVREAPTLREELERQFYDESTGRRPVPIEDMFVRARAREVGRQASIWEQRKQATWVGGIATGTLERLNQTFLGGMEFLADAVGDERFSSYLQNLADESVEREQASRPIMTPLGEWVFDGIISLLESAPTLLLGGPVARLVLAGVQVGTKGYGKYRGRGGTPNEALMGAVGEGLVEVLAEKIPFEKLFKNWADPWIGRALKDQLGEQVATHSQDAIDTAVANPSATWEGYLSSRGEAVLKTIVGTVIATGANHAASAAIDNLRLDGATKDAAQSKLRARDPEGFVEFLGGLVDGTPNEKVYISGKAVREHLRADPQHDREFWAPYAAQIEEAAAVGGDVVIPTAQVVTHLSGTKAWDVLGKDTRMAPGGMTPREVAELGGNIRGLIAEIAQDAATRIEADRAAAEPRARLAEALAQKLTAAGFAPEEARQYAELGAARAATRAARLEQPLTGTEADALVIERRELEDVTGDDLSFEQDDVATAAWSRTVDRIVRGERPGPVVRVGRTPAVLRKLGFEPVDLVMASAKLAMARREHPEVSLQTLRDLPKLVSNPRAAFPSGKNDGSIVLAVDAIDVDGNPIVVPILAQAQDGNVVLSVYGKENGADWIERQIAKAVRHGEPVYMRDGFADAKPKPEPAEATSSSSALIAAEGPAKPARTILTPRTVVKKTLDQTLLRKLRGRVVFTENQSVIQLFESADRSTFLHETGHIWLEELWSDAVRADASEQLRHDRAAIEAWFAAKGHPVGPDGQIPVGAHELWARGVERYLMEGKAPSVALRRAFEAFKSWLVAIYKSVRGLRSPITPEIRDVMDRLIATDAEIAEATRKQKLAPLFADAPAVATAAEFADYRAAVDAARAAATDALLDKAMVALRAAQTKAYRAQEAEVRREVTDVVDAMPAFVALKVLRQKDGMRLDRQWLIDSYGADAPSLVPQNVPAIYARDGSAPDAIAEAAGFESGDAMIRALMEIEALRKAARAEGDRRSVRQRMIDEETDAIMKERHGDPLNDGSIERLAGELVHNDLQGEAIAFELQMLERMRRAPGDHKPPSISHERARQWAASKVAQGKVSEYISRAAIERFRRAARNAAAAAAKAMRKGDLEEAHRQKQAQLLNNALAAEAAKAAEAVEAAESRLAKVADLRPEPSERDYLEPAQALLALVGLKAPWQDPVEPRDLQERFAAWAREQKKLGIDLVVAPDFAEALGETHHARLTVEELLALDAAVQQMMRVGRTSSDDRKKVPEALLNPPGGASERECRDAEGKPCLRPEQAKSRIRQPDAAMLKVEQLCDWLDQGEPNGPWRRLVFKPMADAQARERDLKRAYAAAIDALVKAIPRSQAKDWDRRVDTPELVDMVSADPASDGAPIRLGKDQIVAIALNWANAGSRRRLVEGYGWSEGDVKAVLDRLMTQADWVFVQGVWDAVDALRPDLAALERRVNGAEPEPIEATVVETRFGTLRGGYFPAVYDTSNATATELDAEEGKIGGGPFFEAATRATASGIAPPVLLSMSVVTRHMADVIHDITHREAAIQVSKILADRKVRRAIDDGIGREYRKALEGWLDDFVRPAAAQSRSLPAIAALARHLRRAIVPAGPGQGVRAALAGPLGLEKLTARIGERAVLEGMAAFVAHPGRTYREVTQRSGQMRDRFAAVDASMAEIWRGRGAGERKQVVHAILYAELTTATGAWIGAFNQGLRDAMSEGEATAHADEAIRTSHGTSAVSRAQALAHALRPFFSYLDALYGRERNVEHRAHGIALAQDAARRGWWAMVVPPLLEALVRGDGPEEDDAESWAAHLSRAAILGSFASIPGIGALPPAWGRQWRFIPSPPQGDASGADASTDAAIEHAEHGKGWIDDVLATAEPSFARPNGQVDASVPADADAPMAEQAPEDLDGWYEPMTIGTEEPASGDEPALDEALS